MEYRRLKGIAYFLLVTTLLFPLTRAFTISPSSVNLTLKSEETKWKPLTIETGSNESLTLNINSSNPSLVVSPVNTVSLDPNETFSFNLFIKAPKGAGTYTGDINIKNKTVPVTVKVKSKNVTHPIRGELQPLTTRVIQKIETGAKISKRLCVRNKYDTTVQVRNLMTENTIITKKGISKPVGIGSVDLPLLKPGQDFCFPVIINAKKVKPGSYSGINVVLAGYVGDKRILKKIPFDITVIGKMKPQLKEMKMKIKPESPEPGDKVKVILKDKKGKVLEGKSKVTVYNLEGKKLKTASAPFKAGKNRKYCINSTKPGYKSVSDCFKIVIKPSSLSFSPSNPRPGEDVQISFLSKGNLIKEGSLKIEGEEYDTTQKTLNFTRGTHTIIGKAEGYETSRKTLEVLPPLKFNLTGKFRVGKEIKGNFNQVVHYVIRKGGKVVKSGSGRSLSFKPKEEGTYSFYAKGKKLETKKVKKGVSLPSISGLGLLNYWYIILPIIIVGIIILVRRGGKRVIVRRRKSTGKPPEGSKELK